MYFLPEYWYILTHTHGYSEHIHTYSMNIVQEIRNFQDIQEKILQTVLENKSRFKIETSLIYTKTTWRTLGTFGNFCLFFSTFRLGRIAATVMGGFFASPASDPYDGRREHRNIHVGRKSISRLWVCRCAGLWVCGCVCSISVQMKSCLWYTDPGCQDCLIILIPPGWFWELNSYQEKSSTIQFVHFEKHGLHCTCTYHDEWMSTVTWCILYDLAIIASRCYTYRHRGPFLVASLCSVPLDLPRQVFQM